MEAKDLRVGNLIIENGQPKPITGVWYNEPNNTNGLASVGVSVAKKGKSDRYKKFLDIKPLPITIDWLFKLGFTNHHDGFYNDVLALKNVTDFETGKLNKEFVFVIYPNELGSGITPKKAVKLKYVHQLQNLYYGLTGEELKF